MTPQYQPVVGPSEAAKHITDAGYSTTAARWRLWCKTFASYLSDECNGNPRRIGPRDLQVLTEIGRLRAQNITLADIEIALNEMTFPEVVGEPAAEVNQPVSRAMAAPVMQVVDVAAIGPLVEQLVERDKQLLELTRRIQQLESGRWMIIAGMIGFTLGAGLMAAAWWLV
jgi:DNA-binding transcriptional MerR regulator